MDNVDKYKLVLIQFLLDEMNMYISDNERVRIERYRQFWVDVETVMKIQSEKDM